jgi:hypothetical protein
MKQRKITYTDEDKFELDIRMYITKQDIGAHDVDNRLKDIMDALQGRAGGPKSRRSLDAIIPNDRQVYRVAIEKRIPPGQSKGFGHVIIRKLRK